MSLRVTAQWRGLLTYQWWKDGELITANHHPNCSGISSPLLHIKPFLPENVGSYKCVVSHIGSEAESRSANLTLGGLVCSHDVHNIAATSPPPLSTFVQNLPNGIL